MNIAASTTKVTKRNNLLECIDTILNRNGLHLNVKKIFDILENDLEINLRNVSTSMKYILAECLHYYITMWPGWLRYDAVCTNETAKIDYIEEFKKYLDFKIKYIIQYETVFNRNVEIESAINLVDAEVQNDPINEKNKPEAPYNLVISGPPNEVNNIVLIGMDNNIVIKHRDEESWVPLNASDFLNYSFVHVSVKLPDLELSRSNLHEYQRYITECEDTASCPEVNFIRYVRKTHANAEVKVFTLDYIYAYCKQFIATIQKIPTINTVKIAELVQILRQFMADIKESNIHTYTSPSGKTVSTMASDISVCFNIGGKTYIRNKKMANNDNDKEAKAINICEVIIPRMAYTLSKFLVEEDTTTDTASFVSLNALNEMIANKPQELYKFVKTVNSCVTYQCLFCRNKVYSGDRAYIDILDHYRSLHKGEQSVLCFKCRKEFTTAKLAGSRWSHKCEESAEAPNTATSVVSPSIELPTTNDEILLLQKH